MKCGDDLSLELRLTGILSSLARSRSWIESAGLQGRYTYLNVTKWIDLYHG